MSRLSRRQFVVGAGAAGARAAGGVWAAAGAGGAASEGPTHRGALASTADPSDADNAAFRQGLRDLGYSEGQNITLEWRSPGGRIDQYPELAADLVRRSVDVIVAQGTAATSSGETGIGHHPDRHGLQQ